MPSLLTLELSDRKRRHRAVLLGTATFSTSRVQVGGGFLAGMQPIHWGSAGLATLHG